ncbi:RICIN domain-containing protein [Streptomyces sp. NPDC057702]|uniref:RICIN domain-containing protein n=1 Tax=unclassified Streptomyces TaxID=2593676 RepID=UPI0036CB9C3B
MTGPATRPEATATGPTATAAAPSGADGTGPAPDESVAPPGDRDAPLAGGWVTMRPAGSATLCVTEGRERNHRTDREIAVQLPCAEAPRPRVYLEHVRGAVYRVQWHHPAHGRGCLGVDEPASAEEGEELLSPGACTDVARMQFRLEPFRGGYRMRPVDSGQCLGLLPPRTRGAEVVQVPCADSADQSFHFRPA